MELLQLRYFVSVVELNSISEAARKHSIPQPSMSQTISKLEKELGNRLFDRVSNRIVINRNGQLLYEQAKRALQALDDGMMSLRESNGDMQNHIDLVVTNEAQRVMECIFDFIKEHPDARFVVRHHLQDAGADVPYDLCVTHHNLGSEFLASVNLVQSMLYVAVPKEHRYYDLRVPFDASMLLGEPIILTRSEGGIGKILNRYLQKQNIELEAQVQCNDPMFVQSYLNSGMGLAIVSDAYRPLLSRDIRLIPFAENEMIETTRLYWHNDRYLPLLAREFRSKLIECFQNLPFGASD